jgi:hypothetical protein
MSKIIKFIDFYERQLEKKEYEKHQWYYDELDRVLDELFEVATEEFGMQAWKELAERSGLAYNTIVNLGERWTKRPQYRTVLLIAKAVGRDIALKAEKKKGRPSLRVVSA